MAKWTPLSSRPGTGRSRETVDPQQLRAGNNFSDPLCVLLHIRKIEQGLPGERFESTSRFGVDFADGQQHDKSC